MITLNQLKNTIITILSIVENKLDWNNLKNKPFYSTNDGSIKKLDSKYLPEHNHTTNEIDGYEHTPGKFVEGNVSDYGTSKNGAEIFNDYEYNVAIGEYSHAEGFITKSIGNYSHAEGYVSEAGGICSHAEGKNSEATGMISHAEGDGTKAYGDSSHAEGSNAKAYGYASHVEGGNTTAYGEYQHVQGKYNIEDIDGTYAHIVGNGDWDKLSNAHTLDWDGNAWFQGEVYIGGTGQDDEAAKKLMVEPTVDDALTLLMETGYIEPVADEEGIITDDNNVIYTL